MPEETLARLDEFAFVLLGGLLLLIILVIGWSGVAPTLIQISPQNKTFYLPKGGFATFDITLSGTASDVVLEVTGDAKEWIELSKHKLNVTGEEKVRVKIRIPAVVDYGEYDAEIRVKFYNNEKKVLIKINVVKQTEKTRKISFGDFVVSYMLGEFVEKRENFKVEKGYFVDYPKGFVAIVEDRILPIATRAYFLIVVDDTNGLGNLIVEINGKEYLNRKVGQEEIMIELPLEELKRVNRFRIKAGNPGIVFWANTVYEIKEAKFVVEYNGTFFRSFEFILDSSEISELKEVRLSFKIKDYDPKKLNDLIITINGREVFRGVPTLVYFSKKLEDVKLEEGENTISFSVEPDTFYELEDVTLTITRTSYES